MSHREIVILTPRGIDTTIYRELLPTASHLGIDPRWMTSHAAYNRLIISPLLGKLFAGYSHLLLCEPDSLLLSDSLSYWCQQPFDFIGAPWFQPSPVQEGAATFVPGGNTGFSLFRLSTMRMVTSSWRRWYPVKHALGDLRSGLRGNGSQCRRGILGLYPGGLLRGAHRLYSSLCDQYWSLLVPRILPSFRVAPPEVAMRFAWEKWSHLCMEMCRGHLPFGIHAWAKYDFDYLRPHLLAAGVDLSGMPPWAPPSWRENWVPPVWPVGYVE